jgi:hypothetical protein
VRQTKLSPPAASKVYELTTWGAELEPVVTHLGRWGSRSPSMNHDADRSVDSLVLSLRALFDSQAAHGFTATIALRLGENTFRVEIAEVHWLAATSNDLLRRWSPTRVPWPP